MTEESTCVLCQANFRPSAMEGNKCKICAKSYPGIETREEMLKLTRPKAKAETLSETRVKHLIYEILEEAGIKRFECENCKSLFFKNSPAQKICVQCRESKENK